MSEGLSAAEARKRLAVHGYNELALTQPKNVWRIALEVMKEPMFILLISCGVLYMIVGDYREGGILLSAILIIIFITFYQYQKTEKALEALKKLSSPRALVLRDGEEVRIPGREVVPGDILLLHEGDRIAADAKLLDTENLTVDESMLTGESIAVTKNGEAKDDKLGLVFSGTMVVQGKAHTEVIATGAKTQFGKIGVSLHGIKQDETRLQKEMKVLIRNLFIIGAIISVGVVLAFYFTRGNFIQSLLSGLAASMAILPEEFPVVFTIFMALGAWRLSKKNVLTRKPSVIETMGSTTVLCTDKTGTITQNKMEVAVMYNGKEVFLKSIFEEKKEQLVDVVSNANLASQKDSKDPMEIAICHANSLLNLTPNAAYKLIKEYPLSREVLAMTRVLENDADHTISVSAKGAPEAIFTLCKMNEADVAKHTLAVNQMAEQGYRVLAVAKASSTTNTPPQTQQEFDFTFLGLLGLEDPIRPEVPQAIKECNEAGIKVIMITGDYPTTAKSIANQIGMKADAEIIIGEDIEKMSDTELRKQIKNANIFARVVPEQKLRIVQALKANKEIVAMTGDGVNDAPALKAAHIGIAMGKKGTDVAREASSLVLLDDNFASIVSAIRAGRKIFDNLQKAMSYILAIHIPIIGLALLPAFIPSLPLFLMPLHIIFMELIIDPVCSIAFETEQEEKGIMQRPPANPKEKFFGARKIGYSVVQGCLLLLTVVAVYFISLGEGYTAGEVRVIAFTSLIVGNIFLILTNLSKTRNFLAVFVEKNHTALFILLGAMLLLLLTIFVPALSRIFSFQVPGLSHFIAPLLGACSMLCILEVVKFVRNKRNRILLS